ncbi:DNA topoisomerase [Flavobacterium sp. WW92]|uniref:type IA DNA topoisomerase n=1 Tax=unclassified Flavobacterium TaxID=196869 RepID=UPI0022258EDA|nr:MULTISPECIES: type IA DNA topoisomerase [unclassified Flavobacterium]WDO12342.1 DNA topoisomerase [Flavobacterium sp. WW92]
MKAIIAEKPSMAREIAAVVGARERKDGYISGNGYLVTWAFGHLVGLAMPEDYGIVGFREENLPILPDPFLLTPRRIKTPKGYEADPSALSQLKVIAGVIGQCQSIIVATDAGREGELIFRYIYQHLGCRKPFERLWISSLTEKAIRKGMQELRPGKEFESLYLSAMARSHADWVIGINASQALSLRAGEGTYSLGRVQTPVLAMICLRYQEHREFASRDYWQLQLQHRKEYTDFTSLSEKKWEDRKEALAALRIIERGGRAFVKSVDIKAVAEQPPLLFDLTGLQKQANRTLSLSASETLEIAQSLYEKRFITYPRTASRHITEDLWPEVPALIRLLAERLSCRTAASKANPSRLNRRIVDDLKVTDHHGLLITEKIPTALSARENAMYDMIAMRLLESLAEPCHKEMQNIQLEVGHHDFTIRGAKVLQPGWRALSGSLSESTEELQSLPTFKEGDEIKISSVQVLDKKTVPPALYNEASLLQAMESAGKLPDNPSLAAVGLGTPATRAAIIETLFSREYIRKEKKQLIPTEKGLQVYQWVHDMKIADAAMTAQWELAFKAIENGETSPYTFQKDIEEYARAVTSELLGITSVGNQYPQLPCPKCKGHNLIFTNKIVKCPDIACGWIQFRMVCKVQISIEEIISLITNGRTSLITGMQSNSGKKFDAYLYLSNHAKVLFKFD